MKLDKEQEQAVKTDKKKVIVVAGAGSGKTRVLTERVKYLIESGVEPVNIACITFTNMAAQEMKKRLSDVDTIGDAFIGTIHSFANTIYKTSGFKYQIFNFEVKIKLYREVLENRTLYRNLTFQKFLRYLDYEKMTEDGLISEEELSDFLLPSERDDLAESKKEVRRLCKERSIVTFAELLEKTREYYHMIGGSLKYVLVDEFQDVGALEASFIKNLNAENEFYVGDDWQSIYGFNGGDVKIFKNLINDENFTTYYLQNNYRNASSVLDIAKKVIDQVESKIEKDIKVISDNEGEVVISTKGKIDKFLDDIKEEEKFKDWFILTRTNREALTVADLLHKKQIPIMNVKKAGVSFEKMNEILSQESVKILTVHSAKGLENKNVLLYGNFPINVPTYMKNEDERKVMYVGITRAKNKLILLN